MHLETVLGKLLGVTVRREFYTRKTERSRVNLNY